MDEIELTRPDSEIESVRITTDEVLVLLKRQHLVFTNLISTDGIFQAPALEERLNCLSDNEEDFRATRTA
jgi:hypothetical protein